jgi:hypothetical protein
MLLASPAIRRYGIPAALITAVVLLSLGDRRSED